MKLTIDPSAHDQRLDRFFRKRFPGISRNEIFRLLRTRPVRRDGKRLKPNDRIYTGDVLDFDWPDSIDTAASPLQKVNGQLTLIAQSDDYLVVYKPIGLKTIPDRAGEMSLSLLVQSAFVSEQTATFRMSPVSRLDRNTSGVVLFGRTYAGLKKYNQLMRRGQIRKYYLAIIFGTIKEEATYEIQMEKDRKKNKVEVGRGQWTHTRIKPIVTNGTKTLIEVELLTGHAHQIRALMSHLGHPIEGDPKYGRGGSFQWLAAHRLEFDGHQIYYLSSEFRDRIKEEFNYVAGENHPNTCQQFSI